MKKTLAMIAVVVFLVGLGAPTFANTNSTAQSIELADDDPKKAKTTKKAETTEKSSCGDAKAEKSSCGDAKSEDSTCSSKKSCDTSTEKKK